MLQIHYIREHQQEVIDRLSIKHVNAKPVVEQIIMVDDARRVCQQELDAILTQLNSLAKEIGNLFKQGKQAEADVLKEKTTIFKNKSKELSDKLQDFESKLEALLIQLPNAPHASVPKGKSAEDNQVVFQDGKAPELEENAVPHWDLAKQYDIIDFELGNKITGAGFPVYKGQGARLQHALINFFIDQAVKYGYLEIQPPYLVNEASAYGTGQLPDKDAQMYQVELDKFYLIPTAEVPITNLYRNEILKEVELPIKNVSYTACFRREAGSYGKDVRGLNRLHQFDKVEIVQIQHPAKSYETLEEMRTYVASLIQMLELPFRIVKLCGGDLSFTSAMTYDFEVYAAAQKRWLEVSSVSNFESFQSNRMKLRFKDKDGKMQLAHTLNGSAVALPRIVAALLENNQTSKGIRIPKVLWPYTGFDTIK